jgi:hypothetical protein
MGLPILKLIDTMKTLRDEKCRAELIGRLELLTPDAKPAWGRMNVEQMLSHLVQSGELPFESSVPDRSSWMSRTFIKPLVLSFLPIPKEVQTSAEIDQQQKGRPPLGFDIDKANLVDSINKLGTIATDHRCLDHPFFGQMSTKQWCRMAYKHADHHLRQFGV